MKYFYQFQVWKRSHTEIANELFDAWCTRYTIESDKEYSDRSLNFITSHIVTAERVMLFSNVQITHVVVMELRDGFWFDQNTITRTQLPGNYFTELTPSWVNGARPQGATDQFYCLNWTRNSQRGQRYQAFFRGCVGIDDAMELGELAKKQRALVTNMKGPLARECWRFYAQSLAFLPQVQDEISSDKFGRVWFNELQTSGRRFGFVTDLQRTRSKTRKLGPRTRYIKQLLQLGTDEMLLGLRDYSLGMNEFDHRWGDANYPHIYACNQLLTESASIWSELCLAFGWNLPVARYGTYADDLKIGPGYDAAALGVAKIKHHSREVNEVLLTLFNCHQWLLYLPKVPEDVETWQNQGLFWRGLYPTDIQQYADWIYNDWDFVTGLYFKIADCINVLNSILVIDEPKDPEKSTQILGKWIFYDEPAPIQSVPLSVPVTPFYEVYPVGRDPYFSTLPTENPPEADEALAPVEDIPWDSGPSFDESDDETYQNSMRESVKNALAQLEFVRRWIGKIRRRVPWYRLIQIEQLAPQQDEAQNPFTGEPIEPPRWPSTRTR